MAFLTRPVSIIWLLVAAAVMFGGVIAYFAFTISLFWGGFAQVSGPAVNQAEAQQLLDVAKLKLTDGVTVDGIAAQTGGPDHIYYVRARCPKDALSQFLSQIPADPWIDDDRSIQMDLGSEDRLKWWRPGDAKTFSSTRYIPGPGDLVQVLVDGDDPDEALIYICIGD